MSPTLPPPHSNASSTFELKGSLLTLMVLKLLNTDHEKIITQLARKISQAPHLFKNAPLVIDLSALETDNRLDLPILVKLLRKQGLAPVAARGGNSQYKETAVNIGLGLLGETKRESRKPKPTTPLATIPTKVIIRPVRSGQQVAALEGDLVILSPVSSGAEILAKRHIHVYGALRGRALAGVDGNNEARIFCQHFDAELVSIAGQYQTNEGLDEHLRGKPAQIYLEEDKLKIEVLDYSNYSTGKE